MDTKMLMPECKVLIINNPPAFEFNNHNVPCVACSISARGAKIMIPGKVNQRVVLWLPHDRTYS